MRALICLTLFVGALVIGCDEDHWTVKYEVTGTAQSVSVTYENADGGTSQADPVSVPWQYTFNGEKDDFVYISAQNLGTTGSVTVTIYKDDDVFKTSTSTGEYVIATASGTL